MEVKKLFTLIFFGILVLTFGGVFGLACEEGQVDINIADKEELQEITHIGPATADEIILYRKENLFGSLDDLVNVRYIGQSKIEDIKSKGIACVTENSKEENENGQPEEKIESKESEDEIKEEDDKEFVKEEQTTQIKEEESKKPKILDPIDLSPKDIKSEDNFSKTESGYALYGFVAFSILIGILFLVQKNRYKNEFR